MNPSDVARIISDDIDWNASEEEYLGDSDDDEVNNSMRFDLLDMAEVSFCSFSILASVREDFYRGFWSEICRYNSQV